MGRGRHTLLTPELIKLAVELKREGNYDVTVYNALGIGHETWYKWIRKGEECKGDIYEEFTEAIKKAAAEAVHESIKQIRTAAKVGNWMAAAWYLERTQPELYGKKERLDVKNETVIIKDDI